MRVAIVLLFALLLVCPPWPTAQGIVHTGHGPCGSPAYVEDARFGQVWVSGDNWPPKPVADGTYVLVWGEYNSAGACPVLALTYYRVVKP